MVLSLTVAFVMKLIELDTHFLFINIKGVIYGLSCTPASSLVKTG